MLFNACLAVVLSTFQGHELAYSYCRFAHCSAFQPKEPPRLRRVGVKEMGCCTLTDGTFVWPEGYAHYVQCHSGWMLSV